MSNSVNDALDIERSDTPDPKNADIYLRYVFEGSHMFYLSTNIKALKPDEVLVYETNTQFGSLGMNHSILCKEGYGSCIGRGWHGKTIGLPLRNDTPDFYEMSTERNYSFTGLLSLTLEDILASICELKQIALTYPNKKFILWMSWGWDIHGNPLPSFSGHDPALLIKLVFEADLPPNVVYPFAWHADEILWQGISLPPLDFTPKYIVKDSSIYLEPALQASATKKKTKPLTDAGSLQLSLL
jgi:hypothetical protein